MADRVTFLKEEYKEKKIRIYITFSGMFQSNITGDKNFESDIDCLDQAKQNIENGTIVKIKRKNNIYKEQPKKEKKVSKGWYKSKSLGYIFIKCPKHPFSNSSGYIREHRLVKERWLRKHEPDHPALIEIDGIKYLSPDWDVHHWNERKTDNRPINLEPAVRSTHNSLHKNSELIKHLEKTGKSIKELFEKQEPR